MDSLLFAINAVAPIVILVTLGYILKRYGFMNADFSKKANRLVFHVFLPTMLFLNIYKIENLAKVDFGYVLYVIVILLIIFLLSLPVVMAITKSAARRGVLIQAAFRSNYALIGIPLSEFLFGYEGVAIATLLSAAMIPALNILAVISLSMFSDNGKKPSVKKILVDIAKNPLIRSIALGVVVVLIRSLFVKLGITFRISHITPVYTALEYLSNLATPLALIVLGAQFEFSAVAELRREIIFGVIMRTAAVPILGIGCAYFIFGDFFGGAHFAAFVAAFATPVAVSSVPMAQEMGGDTELAGQLVIWTTLTATLAVFMASFLLRMAGVFA